MNKQEAAAYAKDFVGEWVKVVKDPGAFFAGIEPRDFKKPVQFLITCVGVPLVIRTLFQVASALASGGFAEAITGFMISIILAGLTIGFSFLSALVQMGVAKALGSETSYEHCYWVTAYAAGPLVLSFIPFFDLLMGFYSLFIYFLGVKIVHQFPAWKALVVILIPALIGAVLNLGPYLKHYLI